MNITVRYTRDLRRTFRSNLRLRRGFFLTCAAAGGLLLVLAIVLGAAGGFSDVVTWLVIAGLVLATEPPALIWLSLRRNRTIIVTDVEVEVTGRGITTRTATGTAVIEWGMVRRVAETKDLWLFIVNRLQLATLYKGALTPDQRAELTAFLAQRPWEAGAPAR